MKELGAKVADDMGYTRKDENPQRPKASFAFKPRGKILIGGAGIILLIILIALFSGRGDKLSPEDLPSIQFGLNQLEQKITRLEGIYDKIGFLEKQGEELQESLAETGKSARFLALRLDKLTQNVDRLQKIVAPLPAKTEGPLTIQRKTFPLVKGRYHQVRRGDSLYRIAQQYGTSVDELCRLNNMTRNQVIHPGQKLLVAPDRRR
jgi:LysM repeat protein